MIIETALLVLCVSSVIAGYVCSAILWWKSRPTPEPDVSDIVKHAPYHLLQETRK
ncbi:hypothetical protein [Aliiroseovarius crassostreae]|uniref:hypothetical protein n=1 Tax=Aliiroseovarius crassostreae TaxID=154981 RepID=UPI002206EEA7|nr:hypothetical protein [Aliiroseovarius crassostreae]UWP88438.1 hypothetical protein K3J57_11100 [Aliiroseovarius crassostreae]